MEFIFDFRICFKYVFFLSFFRLPKACGSHYTKYCTQKGIYTPVGTPTPTAARSHYHCVSVKAVAFH